MKKSSIRVVGIIMIMMMLLTAILSGCGASQTKNSGNASTSQNTSGNAVQAGPAKPVDIKITFWEMGWEGPLAGKDKIAPEVAKRIGVNIIYEPWVVSNMDAYNQKLNLWISSDEMPDVLSLAPDKSGIINRYGDSGKLWDLKEFVENNPDLKDLKALTETSLYYSSPKAGAEYFYPTQIPVLIDNYPLQYVGVAIMMRKDWLDKLGLGYPRTPDEFYSDLKAFKENIKDVNGQPIIPLTLSEGMADADQLWKMFTDRSKEGWRYENGKYTQSPVMDVINNTVVFFNKLYREGLLDPEIATIKESQYQEKMNSGRVGCTVTPGWNLATFNDNLKKIDSNGMYVYIPYPKAPGVNEVIQQYITRGASSGYIVSKRLPKEQVQALFKLFGYSMTKEGWLLFNYGIQGEHWKYNADGKVEYTKEFSDRTKGDWNKMANEGVLFYQFTPISITSEIRKLVALTDLEKRADVIESEKNLLGTVAELNDKPYLIPPGPVEGDKSAIISKTRQDLFIKAILAKSEKEALDIVSAWPETWKKLGGEEIDKEKNDLINARKWN